MRWLLILLLAFGSVAEAQVRDAKGRIVRSKSALTQFKQLTGYPKGRPGYVIDHIIPLACGGLDHPSNLQWQTRDEAKEKDKWERRDCPTDRTSAPRSRPWTWAVAVGTPRR